MINSEILDNKYVVKDKNGNVIVDLTRSTYNPKNSVPIRRIVIVTEDYEGRPDLIAQSTLGDASKFDYICKFNGISNPFSIKRGDYILIPDDTEFKSNIFKPRYITGPQDDTILEDFILRPKTAADEARLEALKEIADNSTVLPPNINSNGENNVVITDEKIILGASTTEGVMCEDTLPRKRVKEMLKNNL